MHRELYLIELKFKVVFVDQDTNTTTQDIFTHPCFQAAAEIFLLTE